MQITYENFEFTLPKWAAEDFYTGRIMPGPAKLELDQFPNANAFVVTVGTGGASANATTIPLESAVAAPTVHVLPKGTALSFGGAKFAVLAEPLNESDATATVEALPAALAAGDEARFSFGLPYQIDSGTFVGRTYTERDSGDGFGEAAATDDELYLIAFAPKDLMDGDGSVALLSHGTKIYEDKLPGWDDLAANIKAAIRERYECMISAEVV